MFQQRRQQALGNIKLGNLSQAPTFEDVSFLLEQAMKYRGRFAEVGWSVPKTGAAFQLTAKIVGGQAHPSWMLYGGPPGNSQLIWGHNASDLTLIHNLVMLECEKPLDGGNSISAGAMDSMIGANTAAGATAGTQLGVVGGAPAAPGAQWLQNLTERQAAAQSDAAAAATAAAEDAPPVVPQEGGMTAPDAVPAMDPSVQAPGDLLDGSLTNISVANLFRYLTNNRLSGRLAIQGSVGAGEVFFQSGSIKHAATLESKGENALFDLATWHEGEFHFHAEEQTTQSTVAMPAPEIIQGCARIIEYFRSLIQQGLHPASYLVRTQELSRPDFERAVMSSGLKIDVYSQHRIFEESTGNRNFAEILRMCPLVRAEWIPVVYSLVQGGLLKISDKPVSTRPGMYLEGEPINSSAIETFVKSVSHPNGLLSSGALLYMLQQEYHRHERTGSRFSLALYSIAQTNLLDGNVTPIDDQAFNEAVRRILGAKRKLDVVGYFDEKNCAILLPETDAAGAAVFANRIIHLMRKPALTADAEGQVLVHSFGIACVPDDARELETLIAAARVAKNKSRMMGAPVILYGDAQQ